MDIEMKKESLDILDGLIQTKIKQIESFDEVDESSQAGRMSKSLSNLCMLENS